MARTTVRLVFTGEALTEPVIYMMGKKYPVVTNIRRAEGGEQSGWIELEVEGDTAAVDQALEYCRSRGVTVERVST